MIGHSVPMRRLMNLIDRTASSNLPAIITGETGTGKEVTAREIHRRSARRGPFVAVNCAAIAEGLFESELFGHEKGSFTGADRRRQGHIERANCGTLFLDEITEMRSDAQAKLLRVIEEKTVLPVGGTEEIHVDVRFLAASNRPTERAITEGRLREDLYYRLNGLSIELSPLRERIDDLPLLIDYFIAEANRDHHRRVEGLDDKCRRALGNYRWPGNIRQLHNVIETAVLLAPSNQISLNELPEEIRKYANGEGHFTVFLGSPLDEVERELIRRTIAFADGNKARASEILGVPRRTLYVKLERYDAPHKSNGRANGNGHRAPRDGRNSLK
jgi:transcriptional regulator with PAS, ATPase and Fis domain